MVYTLKQFVLVCLLPGNILIEFFELVTEGFSVNTNVCLRTACSHKHTSVA